MLDIKIDGEPFEDKLKSYGTVRMPFPPDAPNPWCPREANS